MTLKEYLQQTPEALTLQELIDWLYNQNTNIKLYLELKTKISLSEIVTLHQSQIKPVEYFFGDTEVG